LQEKKNTTSAGLSALIGESVESSRRARVTVEVGTFAVVYPRAGLAE
jgi:hypothetical protein